MNSFIPSGNSGGFDNGVSSRLSNSASDTNTTKQVNKEQNLQMQTLTSGRIQNRNEPHFPIYFEHKISQYIGDELSLQNFDCLVLKIGLRHIFPYFKCKISQYMVKKINSAISLEYICVPK